MGSGDQHYCILRKYRSTKWIQGKRLVEFIDSSSAVSFQKLQNLEKVRKKKTVVGRRPSKLNIFDKYKATHC